MMKKTPSTLINKVKDDHFSQKMDIPKLLLGFAQKLKWAKSELKQQKKPWFFLIGETGSGKSSWLKQMDSLSSQVITNQEEASKIFITEKAVFVDFPGIYLEKNYLPIWPQLKILFKQEKLGGLLEGMILFVNLNPLLEQIKEEQQQFLQSIKYLLQHLATLKHQISLHLIITHIDCLYGFNEFFAKLSQHQRDEIFGISFPEHLNYDKQVEYFSERFLALTRELNQQSIHIMQRERHVNKRCLLKEFPIQFETLKSPIAQLIQKINQAKPMQYFLMGIYFCSATHLQTNNIDRLQKNVQSLFPAVIQPTFSPKQTKDFFIKKVVDYIIQTTHRFNQKQEIKRYKWLNLAFYSGITCFGLLMIAFFTHSFQHNMKQLNEAEQSLQNYLVNNQQDSLQNLNHLAAAVDHLAKQPALQEKAQQAYINALQTQFLPHIAKFIEQKIEQKMSSPDGELYQLLKCYLMLGNLSHRNPELMKNTLFDAWQNSGQFSLQQLQQLKKFLPAALSHQTIPLPLNNTLVKQVRELLNTIPETLLIYLRLKDSQQHENLDPFSGKLISAHQNSQFSIPIIYSKNYFKKVYEQMIPELVKHSHHDWVLEKNDSSFNQPAGELIEEVRELYLADYINWWNLTLAKTQSIDFKSLSEAENQLKILSSVLSPMKTLFQSIRENTAPFSGNSATDLQFNRVISEKFGQIGSFTSFDKAQNYLQKLYLYIKTINHANNTEQSAFEAAKLRMTATVLNDPIQQLEDFSKQNSEPLSSWLTSINQSCWQLILAQSQKYLDHEWKKIIVPEYLKNIDQRYPLFKQAEKEITLTDFIHFFGPQGSLNHYFETYLKPFLNTNDIAWQAKLLNQQKLEIPQTIIDQLQRASLIKQMFFSSNQNVIDVNFSLQPVSFEPVVKKMALTINGQILEDKQSDHTINNFVWPGIQKVNMVQLEFHNIDGQFSTMTTEGDWAWFRLLDRTNFQPMEKSSQTYQVIFDLNGNATEYQLVAKDKINPFIPNIIDQFRIPLELNNDRKAIG